MAFAATVYVARRLGASAYGVVGFAAAVLLYLNRVADFGIDAGLGVREIAVDRGALARLAPALLSVRLAWSVVLAVAVVLVGLLWIPAPDGPVLAVYGLTLVSVGASTRWIHLGLERASRVAIARTLGEVAMLLLVVLLVRRPGDLSRVPLAQFAGDAIAAILLLAWLRRSAVPLVFTPRWGIVRPLIARAWPLTGTALLGLVIFNADLIFLRVLHGSAAVGYYAAAYTLVSFLINLGSAYGLSLLPTLSGLNADPGRRQQLYDTAVVQVFTVTIPAAVGCSLVAGGIIGTVFDAGYGPAAAPLAVLGWSVPLLLVRGVPIVGLMAVGREDLVFRATLWSAVVNLALNVALIPPFGTLGAAGATVATEVVRMILAFRFAGHVGFGRIRMSRLWRPTASVGFMAAILLTSGVRNPWLAVPLGAATYGLAALLLGAIGWPGRRLPKSRN